MKPLLKELRFAALIALAVVCALSLCGCRHKAALEQKAPWVVLPALALCASAFTYQAVRGLREAWRRWRKDKAKRAEDNKQLRDLATVAVVVKKALGHALEHEWQKAHEQIATLPAAPLRDELKTAVSQLEQRTRAAELVRTLLDRAERWADSDSREAEERRDATLLAASELAHTVGITLPPELCRHPYRDSQCCGTCGEGFTAWGEEDEAGAL